MMFWGIAMTGNDPGGKDELSDARVLDAVGAVKTVKIPGSPENAPEKLPDRKISPVTDEIGRAAGDHVGEPGGVTIARINSAVVGSGNGVGVAIVRVPVVGSALLSPTVQEKGVSI
jgi:hypothetical protein